MSDGIARRRVKVGFVDSCVTLWVSPGALVPRRLIVWLPFVFLAGQTTMSLAFITLSPHFQSEAKSRPGKRATATVSLSEV